MEKSPDAFRTISEAAEELDLPQHVLRFWETRFSTIKPLKRGGGRRYYRPEDVLLLKGIRHLLYDQGFTIKGVQRILKDNGARYVMAIGQGGSVPELMPTAGDAEDDYEEIEAVEPQFEAPTLPAPDRDESDFAPSDFAPVVRPEPKAARGLDEADREKLSGVLRELLECKRVLERAREN